MYVYMYVYSRICIYVCMYMCVCVYIYTYGGPQIPVYTYIYTRVCVCLCVFIRVYITRQYVSGALHLALERRLEGKKVNVVLHFVTAVVIMSAEKGRYTSVFAEEVHHLCGCVCW